MSSLGRLLFLVGRLLGLSSLLLLSACATTPLTQEARQTLPAALPLKAELHEVPFYPQELYQCGPASLAEMLAYRGFDVSPDELRGEVYLPERRGSLQLELVAAARARAQLVYPLAPSLVAVLQEIAAGNPVLVLQNLSLPWLPLWHYAVVVGYDLEREELVLRSGTTQRLRTSFTTFERTWARSDYWAIVILPPNQLPATAEQQPFFNAAQQLESLGHISAARLAFEAGLARWPGNAAGLMGLGNTAYTLEDYEASASAFLALTETEPRLAAGWNNLAYALVAQGCGQQAVEAAQCAVKLAPEDKNAVSSLIEILKLSSRHSEYAICASIRCPEPAI